MPHRRRARPRLALSADSRQPPLSLRAGGTLVGLAALWGASFMLIRVAVPSLGALPLIGVRVATASLVLTPLALSRTGREALRGRWAALLVLGACNTTIPFALLTTATKRLPSGVASVLNATVPLWGALVAWWWFGDALYFSRAIGLFLGFGGVVALIAARGTLTLDGDLPSVLLFLLGTLSYAISAGITRKYLSGLSALRVTAGSMLGGAATLLILLPWVRPPAAATGRAWACAIFLGLGSTALGNWAYFDLIGRVGMSRAITVTYLAPVFGLFWATTLLSERFTLPMLGAAALMVLGTVFATRPRPS